MSRHGLPLAVVVLLICFFLCIVNAIYARIEAKSPSTWKKQSVFTTFKAWLTYAGCIAAIISLLIVYATSNVLNGFSNINTLQDSINEQQQTATEDEGTDTTQTQIQN